MAKGSETRDAILHDALKQASQIGLEGISIGALARSVGMSKSGLFAHFGSKAGLQVAVLALARAYFMDRVVYPSIRNHPRGEPRVRALIDAWLDWSDSPPVPGGCLFISAGTEFDDRPGAVRDEVVRNVRDIHATFEKAAAIAVEEGHFRADLDVRQFAFQMHCLMLGYHTQARLFEEEDARQLVHTAVETLLAGCRP